MKELYQQQLIKQIMAYYYERFEFFITRKWCDYELPEIIRDSDRKYAYRKFYSIIKDKEVANRQTIKRWFGLSDNRSIPSRKHIFKIAFAAGLSVSETEEYLKDGISDAGFQVNDYEEYIMMYCLDNNISYERYLKLVELYERKSADDCIIEHTSCTNRLSSQYILLKDYPVEEFLVWMLDKQAYFKGYSLTLLDTYRTLIDKCLIFIRNDYRAILMRELEHMGFFKWAVKQGLQEPYEAEDINRFVKNSLRQKNTNMTPDIAKEIRYLLATAYAPKNRMTDMISEIYTFLPGKRGRKTADKYPDYLDEIKRVDSKYISELLNIALLKEEQMRRKIRIANSGDEEQKKEDRKKLAVYNQRVHQVNRKDLLVLLQYAFCKNLMCEIEENKRVYDAGHARKEFVVYADDVLEKCGMRVVNESYMFDALIMAGFEEKEILLFSEVLEQ